jgi:SPP1 gp7 family putative phage head morphogenesis protein
MPANDDLRDIEIGHAVGLERLKGRNVRGVIALLNASEAALAEEIRRRLDQFTSPGRTLRRADRERMAKLLERIRELRKEVYVAIDAEVRQQMIELASYEVGFQARAIQGVVPIALELNMPTAGALRAGLFSRPFAGKIMRQWARSLQQTEYRRLESAIRMGFLEGETTDQIVRRIRGTRANRFRDGILQASRRDAEAMARTALNHTANAAREELFDANANIISGLIWIATLDGRTTPVCMARDGQVFPTTSGPRPPAHWNCRSAMAPVLNGLAIVGNRPYVIDKRNPTKRLADFRAQAKEQAGDRWRNMTAQQRNQAIGSIRTQWVEKNIGRVPATTNYQEWLSRQSVATQNDVLGKTRAQLFRRGDLKLPDFVDRSGRQYTIQELRQREAEAFERAGL